VAKRFVLALGESVDARLPVYTSSGGFSPPVNVFWAAGPGVPLGSFFTSLQFSGQYQSVGKWHGLEDEGTGFTAGGLVLRSTYHFLAEDHVLRGHLPRNFLARQLRPDIPPGAHSFRGSDADSSV